MQHLEKEFDTFDFNVLCAINALSCSLEEKKTAVSLREAETDRKWKKEIMEKHASGRDSATRDRTADRNVEMHQHCSYFHQLPYNFACGAH